MWRLVVKQFPKTRAIYISPLRLKMDGNSIPLLDVSDKEINIDKIDLKPPVFTEPFTLVEKSEQPSSQSEHSDIAEFVDSLGPPLPVSFNLAAYVNESECLQNLVRLGVDLSEIEKKPGQAKFILNLDFDKHIKHFIQFLHDHGVDASEIGRIITKNPLLFKENMQDLEVRINYLKSKNFGADAIARILTRLPDFLSLKTREVDSRLGFLQKQFSLTGDEVRYVVTKNPKLITYRFDKFREKLFIFKEVFGYNRTEMKKLLLDKPKVWILGPRVLKERFYILHNLMGLSHERILEYPSVLTTRGFILKQRHQYLVHLKRAQYDPNLPLFISLQALTVSTDCEFCEKSARTSIEQYNNFLKSL